MKQFTVQQIGRVMVNQEGIFIKVEPAWIPALQALDGFGYINIFWWFDGCEDQASRSILTVDSPYKQSPAIMGTFATRSPQRPNPIALTVVKVIAVDFKAGLIQIAYIDANDGSPVLDIKPYTPSLDRVENPNVPGWCKHWPKSIEESGGFNWKNEFNF